MIVEREAEVVWGIDWVYVSTAQIAWMMAMLAGVSSSYVCSTGGELLLLLEDIAILPACVLGCRHWICAPDVSHPPYRRQRQLTTVAHVCEDASDHQYTYQCICRRYGYDEREHGAYNDSQ